MNDTIDLLLGHRTIRRYTRDPVPDEHVRRAVEAGQRASTSSAVQAYCLIRVRDKDTRARLVELTGDQEKVATSGAFFVVCGDTRRHRLIAEDVGEPYDVRLEAFLVAAIDATLFAQNVVVAFESMGYGICYIGGLRNRLPEVDSLLDVPEGVYPLYGLCVGRPAEAPLRRPRLPLDAVLLEERYPTDDEMRARIAEHDESVAAYLVRRGKAPSGWSPLMVAKFSAPSRTHLASYYAGKGARLD